MPVKRVYKSKKALKRAVRRRGLRRKYARRPMRSIATNTAAVRENYTVSVPDGTPTFFSTALSAATFNRAQQVAACFQEFRIKYVKLTFKPSGDTFIPTAGNVIPQLYFQMNKYASIPTNANLQTLLDMGCRPIRFDDKNIVRAWKPCVLLGADTAPPGFIVNAQQIKVTPWLTTNATAQNPGATWSPSSVEHLGCVFYVQKMNPLTPTINYNVDVEVVFQYRKPLSTVGDSAPTGIQIMGEEIRPISGNANVV